MSGECPACGDGRWTRRIPLSHAPKSAAYNDLDRYEEVRVYITDDQLYVHLERKDEYAL